MTTLKKATQLAANFKTDNNSYVKMYDGDIKQSGTVQPSREFELVFKWTVSRGRDSYGYNICSLLVDGQKVSSCNGGGYDMQGTVLGNWIANKFSHRLYKLIDKEFTGLSFHDPLFNVNDEKLEKADGTFTDAADVGKTFGELKAAGKVVDLDIHRAWHKASSKTPTEKHIYAIIDGACGVDSVKRIGEAIGLAFEWLKQSDRFKNFTFYTVRDFVKTV